MDNKLVDIVFCLFMLSENLYLWSVRKQLDERLEDLRKVLEGADDECPGQQ